MKSFIKRNSLSDYTQEEFTELLSGFYENKNNLSGKEFADYIQDLSDYFVSITSHPRGNGLIFNPDDQQDDSPEGVVLEVIKWRESQGLSCFKKELE